MLPLRSSLISFRTSNWIFLLVLIYLLLLSGIPIEAQTTMKNATANKDVSNKLYETMKVNPWAKIKGFRSAKFGMNEKSIYKAISKDFKIPKSKVTKEINASEKTTALSFSVPDLFKTGGTATIAYILGHSSKKLMQVNILWGVGAAKIVNGQDIVETANLLRGHFMKKRYQKLKLTVNGKLSGTQTVVFRGLDQKNRMILVLLSSVKAPEAGSTAETLNNISLLLSYIQDSDNPDIRKVTIADDEF